MSQFRKGPKEGQLPMTPVKKSGLWILIGLLSFLLLVLLTWKVTTNRMKTQQNIDTSADTSAPASHATAQTQRGSVRSYTGVLQLNTTSWAGNIIVPEGYEIDWHMDTKDAWLLVRPKRDASENEVYKFAPVGWKVPFPHTVVKSDGRCYGFRLDPKAELVTQGVRPARYATLLYAVRPAKDKPYWGPFSQ